MSLRKILLVGGTHGNEPTGAYLLNKWRTNPAPVCREGFETDLFFANPKAHEMGRRYVDKDLNRCFLHSDLSDSTLKTHEDQRAREVNRLFGKTSGAAPDLIVDMHTTTADMGVTLICNDDPATLRLAAAVRARMGGVNIYSIRKSDRIDSCLRSLARHGIGKWIAVNRADSEELYAREALNPTPCAEPPEPFAILRDLFRYPAPR